MFFYIATTKHPGFRAQFSPDDIMSILLDPELYIIVEVVWQGIVDVDNVRHAVEKLRTGLTEPWMKVVWMKLLRKLLKL